jgi:two-component system chemotaxis sensor kinase CheA
VTFFSDERATELRQLFFESSSELLQVLNEQGLELEKHPGDGEIIRQVRRTVHTLKGDSAACGYQELSDLAHQLEDLLTPEVAESSGGAMAEAVLIAADTFSSMLSAYRGNLQPPSGEELRQQILALTRKPVASTPYKLQGRFAWNEYEQMVIDDALSKGDTVYNLAFGIDSHCPMRGAAMQLIRNVVQECGRLLAIFPDQSTLTSDLDVVEASIATEHDPDWVKKKCRIPAVIADILVQPVSPRPQDPPDDLLDIFKHVVEDEHETEPSLTVEETSSLDIPQGHNQTAQSEAPRTDASPTPVPRNQAAVSGSPSAALPAPAAPAPEPPAASFSNVAETMLRVDAERIDAVLNLVGELVIGKSMIHQAVNEFDKKYVKDPLRAKFADAMAFQARIINDLQKSVMKIRMVPVEQLFRRFPRLVRDVAKSCNKEVGLAVTGQDTDLDKSILDMLAEPLAHLVRNAIDHGIESAEERVSAGKPAQGTIKLDAYHQGNQIVIEIDDDGRGIDKVRLLEKAVERGVIGSGDAAALSEGQVLNLMFHPGLSTAEHVTTISGRGVGMDVVKSVLDRLKGTISISTEAGKGTSFYLKVPLTLAIIKALLFRVSDRIYAVPLASVIEITRAKASDVHVVDHNDVIQVREQVLPLVHLNVLTNQPTKSQRMFVVVVAMGDRQFGLVVDQLVGEEELVIKALDDHLVATDLVSGASILGDGTVVLILNLASVINRLSKIRRIVGATA